MNFLVSAQTLHLLFTIAHCQAARFASTQCDDYPNNRVNIIYAIDPKTGHIIWDHDSSPYEPEEPFACS